MTNQDKKELEVAEKKTLEQTGGEPTREGLMYVPDVDIIEDQDSMYVRADLPGVKKENVEIDIREGILSLTANVNRPDENWRSVYREYESGGFTRRFTLGEQIDKNKITAAMENGVLTLKLPKAEEAKPRKIQIT